MSGRPLRWRTCRCSISRSSPASEPSLHPSHAATRVVGTSPVPHSSIGGLVAFAPPQTTHHQNPNDRPKRPIRRMPLARLFSGLPHHDRAGHLAGNLRLEDSTMSVTITWHPAATPPDADQTVLMHHGDGQVETGFIDETGWRFCCGAAVNVPVMHWAEFPLPPEAGQ